MTQPVQEPTTQRVVSKLGWGERQLERRPSLAPAGSGTTSAYYDDWVANGTGASIGNDNWTSVVTGVNGANDRWFSEFGADDGGDWSETFASGLIHNSHAGAMFSFFGYVYFDVPDGTLIGVEINPILGAFNTTTVVDGANSVMVYAEKAGTINTGVSLRCYQASGGNADLTGAQLFVRRFENLDNFTYTNAP